MATVIPSRLLDGYHHSHSPQFRSVVEAGARRESLDEFRTRNLAAASMFAGQHPAQMSRLDHRISISGQRIGRYTQFVGRELKTWSVSAACVAMDSTAHRCWPSRLNSFLEIARRIRADVVARRRQVRVYCGRA